MNYYEKPDEWHTAACENAAFTNGGRCTCQDPEDRETDWKLEERKEEEC
jgi:hypothetical protein